VQQLAEQLLARLARANDEGALPLRHLQTAEHLHLTGDPGAEPKPADQEDREQPVEHEDGT